MNVITDTMASIYNTIVYWYVGGNYRDTVEPVQTGSLYTIHNIAMYFVANQRHHVFKLHSQFQF